MNLNIITSSSLLHSCEHASEKTLDVKTKKKSYR